jgi:hypothetical protein
MSTESTELVVLNNAAPAVYQGVTDENGNWGDDDDDLSRPQYIAIKQPSTEAEKVQHLPNGTIYHLDSGRVWEGNTLEMVILKMGPNRGWKPSAPKFVKGEKFVCRSNDRKTPIEGPGLVPQAKDCASCSRASWKDYDKITKLGNKPTCEIGYFILFIDRFTKEPFIYTATRASSPACEAMKKAMSDMSKDILAKTGRRPSSFEFSVRATTVKVDKNYQIKFDRIAKLTPEAAAEFGPLYEKFVSTYNQPITEPEDGQTTVYEDSQDTGQVIEADEPVAI